MSTVITTSDTLIRTLKTLADYSETLVITNATPANKTFVQAGVNTGADTVTITAHGFTTGAAVTLTTVGTLPAPLATSTTYYVIVVDANTIKFATSAANAVASMAIDLTDTGTNNTTTVVVTALSGSAQLFLSNDGTNYVTSGSAQTFSATATLQFVNTPVNSNYAKIVTTLTSGAVTIAYTPFFLSDSITGNPFDQVLNTNSSPTFASLTFTGAPTLSGLTASTALALDSSKKIVSSSTTGTELGFVHGVTSAIQTQLDTKESKMPIGTVLMAPSAPSDGSTWLACDGSSVSQATYATLFASLGHDYMNFTPTVGAVSVNTPGSNIVWTGTYWIFTNGTTTASFSSVGSGSWSNVAIASANKLTSYNAGNKVIAYVNSGTGANISTDGGATYSAHTLPITPATNNIAPGNSTSNFLYVVDSSRSVYTMANGGTTWATTANALPASPGSLSAVWWDGTNWNVVDATNAVIYQTSVAAGTSGWAASSANTMIDLIAASGGSAPLVCTNDDPTIVIAPISGTAYVSSNSGLTFTPYPQRNVSSIVGSLFATWNGYVFFAQTSAVVGNGRATAIWTSKDGKVWKNLSQNCTFNSSASAGAGTVTTNSPANTTTGAYVTTAAVNATIFPVLMTPTATPATQFSLPYILGSFIRAL